MFRSRHLSRQRRNGNKFSSFVPRANYDKAVEFVKVADAEQFKENKRLRAKSRHKKIPPKWRVNFFEVNDMKLPNGYGSVTGNEYLLSKDKPLSSNNFRNQIWGKSAVLNGLPRKYLPHDGRHTCATLLDNAEVSLKIQQMILGHTSKSITSRVYTHKTIRQLLDAINKI